MNILRPSRLLFQSLRTTSVLVNTTLFSRTMASSAAGKRLAGKTILVTGASSGIGTNPSTTQAWTRY